ncbi:MAG: hypothetical protein K2Q97_01240 [Burkholderiaceae bacterium]|nr:hypothetical protein [Burkholderiaceae bacterium]
MAHHNVPPPKPFKPSPQAVHRSIASSTALETGQAVEQLEQKLLRKNQRQFAHIKLAD